MTLIWIGVLIIGVVIVLIVAGSRPGPRDAPASPREDAPVGTREGTSYPGDPDQLSDPYQAQDQQDGHPAPGVPDPGTQGVTRPRRTSGTAVASLALAVLAIIGATMEYSPIQLELVAIGAVICGHLGIRDTAGGRKRGGWMAVFGLILGYIWAIILLVVIGFMLLLDLTPGGIGV